MSKRDDEIAAGCKQLARSDIVLRRIMKRTGPFVLKPQRDYFQILVRSIISQQISTAAARTILQRLVDPLQPHKITPQTLERLDLQTLRTLGVSQQKATYVIDLTDRVLRGELNLKTINRSATKKSSPN